MSISFAYTINNKLATVQYPTANDVGWIRRGLGNKNTTSLPSLILKYHTVNTNADCLDGINVNITDNISVDPNTVVYYSNNYYTEPDVRKLTPAQFVSSADLSATTVDNTQYLTDGSHLFPMSSDAESTADGHLLGSYIIPKSAYSAEDVYVYAWLPSTATQPTYANTLSAIFNADLGVSSMNNVEVDVKYANLHEDIGPASFLTNNDIKNIQHCSAEYLTGSMTRRQLREIVIGSNSEALHIDNIDDTYAAFALGSAEAYINSITNSNACGIHVYAKNDIGYAQIESADNSYLHLVGINDDYASDHQPIVVNTATNCSINGAGCQINNASNCDLLISNYTNTLVNSAVNCTAGTLYNMPRQRQKTYMYIESEVGMLCNYTYANSCLFAEPRYRYDNGGFWKQNLTTSSKLSAIENCNFTINYYDQANQPVSSYSSYWLPASAKNTNLTIRCTSSISDLYDISGETTAVYNFYLEDYPTIQPVLS